jgi:hypothetical protein
MQFLLLKGKILKSFHNISFSFDKLQLADKIKHALPDFVMYF